MASVTDVAAYIIKKCEKMSTVKLEKLAYYCQSWSLAWDGKPLFNEDFQAWANGPVCPELYKTHRGVFEVDATNYPCMPNAVFEECQLETMNIVIKAYGKNLLNGLVSSHIKSAHGKKRVAVLQWENHRRSL